MARYRKLPVEIEAMQYTGDNLQDIKDFMQKDFLILPKYEKDVLIIHTLEGDIEASEGDYIVKGIDGEFYPCKPTIFEKTYEKV